MQRIVWLSVMFVASLVMVGCGVEDYNVVIKNVGTRRVDNAQVTYGEFRSIGGILSPGIWKLHGNPDHPIPAVATVEWRTEDGVMHRKDMEVKKLVPKGFRGDIQFEIADDNTVTVRVIAREKPRP
jgi:hypothetical protein